MKKKNEQRGNKVQLGDFGLENRLCKAKRQVVCLLKMVTINRITWMQITSQTNQPHTIYNKEREREKEVGQLSNR